MPDSKMPQQNKGRAARNHAVYAMTLVAPQKMRFWFKLIVLILKKTTTVNINTFLATFFTETLLKQHLLAPPYDNLYFQHSY